MHIDYGEYSMEREFWVSNINKKFREKIIFNSNLSIFLLILIPLLLIWQGLDFTDTGFALANAQQIFTDPSSVQYGISAWLTNAIGGIWLLSFGEEFGLIGFRFASVLIVYATIFFSFLTLKPYFKKEYVLFGLFLAELFIVRLYWINYNSLTALFYVIAAYFLIRGLQEYKNNFVLLSGFFLGLNIFNRVSNILGISLILCIFAHRYWNSITVKESIKSALFLISGLIIAVLIISGILVTVGQFELFINSLLDFFINYGLNPSSSHSGTGLLSRFIKDHLLVILLTSISIIGFVLISKIYSGLASHSRFASIIFLLGIFVSGLTISIVIPIGSYIIMVIYGFFCLILLMNIIWHCPDKEQLPLLSLTVLLLLIISPLGSNNGIFNAIYGMWLAIPIGLIFVLEFPGLNLGRGLNNRTVIVQRFFLDLSKIETKTIMCLILIFFVSFSLISAYRYTYRDSADRFEMHYSVDHPYLRYVFTTEERAHVVQGLVDELPHYVKKGDYVLAYESIPMVYYLTGSRPYLDNSWPDLYNPDQFSEKLNQSLEERGVLPVVVRAKFSTRDSFWPSNTKPIGDESDLIRRTAMERFIEAHDYRLVWNNEFFEILTPE